MTEDALQHTCNLITALSQELELTSIEIADILWLLKNQDNAEASSNIVPEIKSEIKSETNNEPSSTLSPTTVETPSTEPKVEVYTESNRTTASQGNLQRAKFPDAPSLREPLKLARALRPLMQKISSGNKKVLDEQATANLTAKQRIFIPVFKQALEPWFDLVLVIDESKSMIFWRKTIREFQKLMQQCGAFRDVRTWGLVKKKGELVLQRGVGKKPHRDYNPRELIDPSGRSLILIVSDCVDAIWRNGEAVSVIEMWVKQSPVAIVQMLPEWMWLRTGLSLGAMVQFGNSAPGVANQSLLIKEILLWDSINFATGIKVPVLTLEPEVAGTWSGMVAGKSYALATGFVFPSKFESFEDELYEDSETKNSNYEQQADSFRLTSSPMARKLASLLSAAPVITLPIVRIVQKELLQESQQVHVAEVFLGGIIKPQDEIKPDTNPDNIHFDFIHEEIRDNFLKAASEQHSLQVFDAISKHFAERLGKSLNEFYALLRKPEVAEIDGFETKAFAQISAKVLKRLGGIYARIASEIEEQWQQITQAETDNGKKVLLKPFTFDVATVEVKKSGRRKPQIIITKNPHSSQYFTEKLPNNVTLDMVAIPGGTFLMGAPETEEESSDDERPQHQVTVPTFFMGKYTVTQAQWRAVATLPQVNRELNPDPSYFKEKKEENLPVEEIYWDDAVEFCDRLSKYTGKNYRLPSEAEWEYACRAGTTTPFNFGETITPELANYDGNYTYASGSKGEYRKKTTPVGSFQVANTFGLFDMHGNVWEWCEDDWHDSYKYSYKYAPIDGASWVDNNDNDNQKLLRGGSWFNIPEDCRSACRIHNNGSDDNVCFRVVVGGARTL